MKKDSDRTTPSIKHDSMDAEDEPRSLSLAKHSLLLLIQSLSMVHKARQDLKEHFSVLYEEGQ